jgi:hypothetical protein
MALREILASFGYEIDHAELHKGEAGVSHMIESLRHLGRSVGEAFVAYELKEFVEHVIEGARELAKASIVAGTTTTALQELEHAANMADVDSGTLRMGLMRLQRAMSGAEEGGKGAAGAFHKLGIALKDEEGKPKDTAVVLGEVADKIAALEDPAKQTGMAMQLFGRGGAQLLPMLKKGSAYINEWRGDVEKLGGGFNELFIEKSERAEDATKRLHMAWRSFSVLLVDKLVPVLAEITEKTTDFLVRIMAMRQELDLGRVGLAAFAAVALGGIRSVLGMFGPMLAKLALSTAGFVLLALVAEDFLALMQGDESLVGSIIDHFFGEGSAATFVSDVSAMGASWENFQQGLATLAGTAGADFLLGLIQKVRDLCTWINYARKLLDPFAHIWAAIGGESAGDYNTRIKKERQASFQEHEDDYQTDKNVNHAQYRADFDALKEAAITEKIVADREAQLGQSQGGALHLGPGVPTVVAQNVGVPDYITQGRSYVDKSTTIITTMPGTTGAQAKDIGAAVSKARADRSNNRAAVNALEPAVE